MGGRERSKKPPKVPEFGESAEFGPDLGGSRPPYNGLTLKKLTFPKSVFKELSFDTGFVWLRLF